MFDVPPQKKLTRKWKTTIPIDDEEWNVGLIVGPSGCGKSIIGREIFGANKVDRVNSWSGKSVIDDFDDNLSVDEITEACGAVGFNTIPSWLKPYSVLSNGERFRVDLARDMLEQNSPIVIDEFTSVVDRQVAKIASHATQKHVRSKNKKFIAISCHSDIIDWLQPDWYFKPDTYEFKRRRLRPRPDVNVEIKKVKSELWKVFAPYHYINTSYFSFARSYALFIDQEPVAFAGLMPRPISQGRNKGKVIWGVSRLVTLPDWQGLGLAFVLVDNLGSAMRTKCLRLRTYPAHMSLIRSFHKSKSWKMTKKPGTYASFGRGSHKIDRKNSRPNAVFEYIGECSSNSDWLQMR
jgi:energy-coupling factor transporter ATP-binding protein EcfA2